jgi:hypothetical protein
MVAEGFLSVRQASIASVTAKRHSLSTLTTESSQLALAGRLGSFTPLLH